jgi:hypothetical protein
MSQVDADVFAAEWIAAWNSHDLERIVSHYADDVVFLSPVALERVGCGRVVGLACLRDYWGGGLKVQPDLHFSLINVLRGHQCMTILYSNHRSQMVAETVEFDSCGKIARACACYADASPVS